MQTTGLNVPAETAIFWSKKTDKFDTSLRLYFCKYFTEEICKYETLALKNPRMSLILMLKVITIIWFMFISSKYKVE